CADLRLGPIAHSDLREGIADAVAVVAAGSPERSEPRVATHHDHVPYADGEAPIHELCLWDIRDPMGFATGRPAEDQHSAAPRTKKAGDDLEERGLAAAVGTQDRRQ